MMRAALITQKLWTVIYPEKVICTSIYKRRGLCSSSEYTQRNETSYFLHLVMVTGPTKLGWLNGKKMSKLVTSTCFWVNLDKPFYLNASSYSCVDFTKHTYVECNKYGYADFNKHNYVKCSYAEFTKHNYSKVTSHKQVVFIQ